MSCNMYCCKFTLQGPCLPFSTQGFYIVVCLHLQGLRVLYCCMSPPSGPKGFILLYVPTFRAQGFYIVVCLHLQGPRVLYCCMSPPSGPKGSILLYVPHLQGPRVLYCCMSPPSGPKGSILLYVSPSWPNDNISGTFSMWKWGHGVYVTIEGNEDLFEKEDMSCSRRDPGLSVDGKHMCNNWLDMHIHYPV